MSDLPEILTVKEAAQLLRVSEDVLTAAADAGDVPCAWVGRRRRFSRSAIMETLSRPHPRCSRGAPETGEKPVYGGKIRPIRG